ncbi:hypothetical protein DL93DRAFT_2229850 [Clavulina sp. PMI_390]|nr:hypothetical protein DL93DRAFT_2229850 [Clavulina sp. PMI_390]
MASWDDFVQSKDVFFENFASSYIPALLSSVQDGHLLLLSPSKRSAARQHITEHLDALRDSRAQLKVLQQEVGLLIARTCDVESVLESLILPIYALPLELIQRIITFVVRSPSDIPQIVALSSVSRFWRSSVLSLPELFTAPRWSWPSDVFQDWRSRAGNWPLYIKINLNDAKLGVSVASAARMQLARDLIQQEASSIHTLEVTLCDPHPNDSGKIHGFPHSFGPLDSSFVQQPFKDLQTLVIIGSTLQPEIVLDLSMMPALETLYVPDMAIKLNGQSPHLRHLGLQSYTSLSLEIMFNALHSGKNPVPLQHLTLYASKGKLLEGEFSMNTPQKTLESLHSLQLCDFRGDDSKFVPSLLSHLVAPQLKVLELLESDEPSWKASIESLVSCNHKSVTLTILLTVAFGTQVPQTAGGIEILVLHLRESETVHANTLNSLFQFLSLRSSEDSSIYLPSMKSLVIVSSRKWTKKLPALDMDACKIFFEARKNSLEHLVLPCHLGLKPEAEEKWQKLSYGTNVLYSWVLNNHGFTGRLYSKDNN